MMVGALKEGGPWLVTASVCIVLLFAVLKVVIIDHSLVPFSLLQDERQRTDAALAAGKESVVALARLSEAVEELKRMTIAMREEMDELRRGQRR